MRMRAILAVAALGPLLAGCAPQPHPEGGPIVIPQEIAWRYAMYCIELAGDVGISSLAWDNSGAEAHLDETTDPAIDTAELETEIETCLTRDQYEAKVDPFVDPYERARLYEYYSAVTIPCLAREGMDITPAPRYLFSSLAGGEPWNPYLGMDLPFDRLLELYRACPPRPASLAAGGQ
ncbi:MAG: hypothetical protein ABIQ01_06690 [Pseudolysinimonas sp.]